MLDSHALMPQTWTILYIKRDISNILGLANIKDCIGLQIPFIENMPTYLW